LHLPDALVSLENKAGSIPDTGTAVFNRGSGHIMRKQIKSKSLSVIGLFSSMAFAVFAGALPTVAEPLDYFLVEGVSYDQTVLKPTEILGHDIGDQPARHDLMVSYIRMLADQNPRMNVETIGYSHENRPILFITVSSPENLARLDTIKANHVVNSDPTRSREAYDDLPVVTWVNYGVHGAEASGMDSALPTLYHLAAAEDAATRSQLDNSVILITAVFNPDGHSRRISWITQYGSDVRATDPNHEVQNQYWPGGRTNHYWFDLNRQWLLQTQPESRAWLTKWHEWRPHVSADMHEMGGNSTYYFHPGVPTRKYPLVPSKARELLVEIADYHRAFMDGEGKLYFSEEGFDNYYVGKGSTYPQINGSLGILFEAGAQMGIARESDQGIKTFANNIRTHFRTSLTTIEGAAAMRLKLHAFQREFYAEAADLARADRVKAYVFRAPEDATRVNMFLDLLARHQVAVHKVSGSVRAGDKSYGEESFIVNLNQRQYRMAKALFNRITEFPDKVFYDVSGWTMPLAYGLEYDEVTTNPRSKMGAPAVASFAATQAPDEAPYAYVFRWSDYYAPRAVNRLLSAGIMARVAKRPISVQTTRGTVAFERGTIIVQRDLQTVPMATIHSIMEQIAAEDGITVHAATSGHTSQAGADLGGRDSVSDLKAPKILLITGPGLTSYDAGEVWHLLDHRMKIPVTLVRKERLSRVDLNRYTHMVLVGGSGARLNSSMADKVEGWVRSGGTFIAHRHGANWASKKLFASKSKKKNSDSDAIGKRLTYADKGQNDAEHVIGGALFESDLDITHPLGFGFVRRLVTTNRNTSYVLPTPKDPYAQVAVYSEQPLLSGYASDKRIGQIKGTPMMTAERKGGGAVVLFADNPNFRATYVGAEKLFLNALFFSTAFDRSRSDEDAEAQAVEE